MCKPSNKVEEFLDDFIPGYCQLKPIEKVVIQNFSLMWSLFESKLLNRNASLRMIYDVVSDWKENNTYQEISINECFDYFQNRYITNGKINSTFSNLRFQSGEFTNKVIIILINGNQNYYDSIFAVLAIIYRLRNNFFHGEKWAYSFSNQYNNFNYSNLFLIEILKNHVQST